jgi:hypothetical protein
MPRYFFDTDDGQSLNVDDVGIECESLEQVHKEAVATLPSLASDQLPDGEALRVSVKVRDEQGKYLMETRLTIETDWLPTS